MATAAHALARLPASHTISREASSTVAPARSAHSIRSRPRHAHSGCFLAVRLSGSRRHASSKLQRIRRPLSPVPRDGAALREALERLDEALVPLTNDDLRSLGRSRGVPTDDS